jgi:cell division control protein 24
MSNFQAASNLINPLQLPAFLIKPVQRLCRYPMLLSSLLKLSSEERPLHGSLVEGVAAVKRIADMANRALREKENEETLQNILSRIKDRKGLPLDNAGALLLDDVFGVVGDNRPYTEYHIFLFNRMLMLCRPKETQTDIETPEKGDWLSHGFKKSLSSSALAATVLPVTPRSAGTSAFLSGGAVTSRRAKTPLSIRGALYLRNIVDTIPKASSKPFRYQKYHYLLTI